MLSDTKIRQARPRDRQYKIYDAKGLFIIITPRGGKWWRLNYRFNDKQRTISLGVYPDVSLRLARQRRDEARRQLAEGIDPSLARAPKKRDTFESVAREWHSKHKHTWKPDHAKWIMRCLEKDIFPYIGDAPIDDLTAPMVLKVLRRVESRGVLELTHKLKNWCSNVFQYGVSCGLCERDPAADLRGALPPARSKHYAVFHDPKDIGKLLRDIDRYSGRFVTACALKLLPLLFLRRSELITGEWSEINFDTAEWRVSGERMKMKRLHLVPLSRQAIAVLRDLHKLTSRGRYLFPNVHRADRPIGKSTLLAVLRRIGYGPDAMTLHGFRSMASTVLNERHWHRDAIERQLGHVEGNAVRAAYHHSEYLDERKKMMQAWADYLDELKSGAEVINIGRK